MHPKVGVAAIILNAKGEVLMGLRKGNHGGGTWSFPGGHLDMGESPEDCARRETLEETGIALRDVRFAALTNDVFSDEKHYVTLYYLARADEQPRLCEPDKCAEWRWCAWDELPSPLFLCVQHLRRQGFAPRV